MWDPLVSEVGAGELEVGCTGVAGFGRYRQPTRHLWWRVVLYVTCGDRNSWGPSVRGYSSVEERASDDICPVLSGPGLQFELDGVRKQSSTKKRVAFGALGCG